MRQITWKQMLEKVLTSEKANPASRYCQLATVSAEGKPTNRTIVFRGFSTSCGLLFTTDVRSEKFTHIQHQPHVELAWYFSASRQQFRIAGEMIVIDDYPLGDQSTAMKQWQALSEPSKNSFYSPPPGTDLDSVKMPTMKDKSEPSPFFSVVELKPSTVDFLDLTTTPQKRQAFTQREANIWVCKDIHP